jgi:transposase
MGITSLEVYLKEPAIEIDNNLVENAIRPTALGKKNWLFFGDADAGERSAIIYSIIESCRRHDIEPYTYLRDVLTRLPTMTNRQIKDIVPKAWAAAARNTANVVTQNLRPLQFLRVNRSLQGARRDAYVHSFKR